MTILLIGKDGQKIGNVSLSEAKEMAKQQNLDLMLVNKDKNVYRICDQGKLKYDKKRKEKKKRAQQRAQKVKEIQLRPTIEDGDLKIKLRHVREFLSSGFKTKLVMKFSRRQMAYKHSGLEKMNNIVLELVGEGLATVSNKPTLDGRNINVFLMPPK
jgi:translation initiation factor IF-3